MDWEKLAEARIREWQERPATDRRVATLPDGPVQPLEVQLLEEVLELRTLAREASTDAERRRLSQRASETETRLLVILESSGRPRAAQRVAELLAEAR